MIGSFRLAIPRLRALGIIADRRGTAAVECGMIMPVLLFLMANVVDFGFYTYQRMEVENAAQMGAPASRQSCSQAQLPVSTKCSGLSTIIATAIHATALGTNVTLQSGSPSEGYYCVGSTSGALQYASTYAAKPANCAASGDANAYPGYYVQVAVSYDYSPIFGNFSLASQLPTPITASAVMPLQ